MPNVYTSAKKQKKSFVRTTKIIDFVSIRDFLDIINHSLL